MQHMIKQPNIKEVPTVIIAKTIKGYGMGKSGESVNTTHQTKKLDVDDLNVLQRPF
jgi:pyruvate dehydrogenase complex dehydrogenase (E1) component